MSKIFPTSPILPSALPRIFSARPVSSISRPSLRHGKTFHINVMAIWGELLFLVLEQNRMNGCSAFARQKQGKRFFAFECLCAKIVTFWQPSVWLMGGFKLASVIIETRRVG